VGDIARSSDDFGIAFERAFAGFQIRVEEACGGRDDWPSAIAAAVRAAFGFAVEDPAAAAALTSEALAAGPDGVARHRRLLDYVAERLAAGRELRPGGPELPELTELALVGGLAGLIAERLSGGRPHELPALAPEAVQFVLTPYIGAEEARRVAAAAGAPEPDPYR
jgi:hypothetical protein